MTSIETNVTHWGADEPRVLSQDCSIWSAPGESVHLLKMRLRAGVAFAEHNHDAEQITSVLSGALEFTLAGEVTVLYAGDTVVVPSNVRHSAKVVSEEDVFTVEAFSPPRVDMI